MKSLLLVLSGVLLLTSCTGAAKKVAKEVVEEETEQIASRGSKKLAKELGEELAEKDVKRLLKQLFSEDKLFADRWDKLPERLQASVLKALEHKPALLKFLKSDTKLLDEYIALGSKNALKSPELLSYYAEAMQRSRLRYGYSVLNTIDFVDEGAAIKFVSQGADRRLLGELKDGLLSIKLPDAAEDIFRQPLLRGELIPNTTYKVSSVEGQLKYTLRTDQLGRITQLEGVELRPHQLQQNVLQL